MAWNYENARKRIEAHVAEMPDIEVGKLKVDADLDSLLSETVCREIYGSHVYLDIANFSSLTDAGENNESLKPLLRAIHIYQRQLSWIVESVIGGVRVHFQGARLHALFYRPIDDAEALSTNAFLLLIVVRDFLRYVFNPAFPEYPNLTLCGGADLGSVIGTRNGMKGDRELLFLGDPANHAAKILDTGLRLTRHLYGCLPVELKAFCEVVDGEPGVYRIATVGKDDVITLAAKYGVRWSRTSAERRVADDVEQFPLKDIQYSSATQIIDFDSLSVFNNKAVLAASIFADISGFTAFIASCTTEDQKGHALRVFHVIRRELARVVRHDFGSLRVQYQGDRLQALVHLPEGSRAKISRKATDIAIALQSSMEIVNDLMDGTGSLALAVGVDIGDVVLTRLGQRGHRDRIVLGPSVLEAAANEERTSKRQIGVSTLVYTELDEDVREHFAYSLEARCYTATGLTCAALERKLEHATYAGASSLYVTKSGGGVTVSREEVAGGSKAKPSRSFAG
jgi:hypothetical protein